MEGVRRVALEIAAKRARKLGDIKQSLLDGNKTQALELMHGFFGIGHAPEQRGTGE